jgi:hypothetical protein
VSNISLAILPVMNWALPDGNIEPAEPGDDGVVAGAEQYRRHRRFDDCRA